MVTCLTSLIDLTLLLCFNDFGEETLGLEGVASTVIDFFADLEKGLEFCDEEDEDDEVGEEEEEEVAEIESGGDKEGDFKTFFFFFFDTIGLRGVGEDVLEEFFVDEETGEVGRRRRTERAVDLEREVWRLRERRRILPRSTEALS